MYKHRIIEGLSSLIDQYNKNFSKEELRQAGVITHFREVLMNIEQSFCFSMEPVKAKGFATNFLEKPLFEDFGVLEGIPYANTLLCVDRSDTNGIKEAVLFVKIVMSDNSIGYFAYCFMNSKKSKKLMFPTFKSFFIMSGKGMFNLIDWIRTGVNRDLDWIAERFKKEDILHAERGLLTQFEIFLTLLSCKNIGTITHEAPAKLNKKRTKNNKPPISEYKTLILKPTGKQQASGELQGLWENKLHWCRGHFKTFTEEKPLFGRHVGKYYWPPRLRGNKNLGIINKDYKLET